MTEVRHCVAGFFGDITHAQSTQAQLLGQGLPAERLQIFQPAANTPESATATPPQAGSKAALKDMLVDGAIGGAVGMGLGALAEVAIVAANVSLFIASPLLAPLVLLGWGATMGGTIGAMVGADKQEAPLSALIRDAVSSGQVVLLAETTTPEEAAMARGAMQLAVGEIRDVTTQAS